MTKRTDRIKWMVPICIVMLLLQKIRKTIGSFIVNRTLVYLIIKFIDNEQKHDQKGGHHGNSSRSKNFGLHRNG